VILLVSVTLVVGTSLSVALSSTADQVGGPTPAAAFSHEFAENGDGDDEVVLTLTHGSTLDASRVILVASKPVDLGGPDNPPNGGYATRAEKLTEGGDQVGIGPTWKSGESIRFGANGDLEGTTVRLVWNPVEIKKDDAGGREPSSVVGEESSIIYEATF